MIKKMKITFTYEDPVMYEDTSDRGFYDPRTRVKSSFEFIEDGFKNFNGGLAAALREARRLGCTETNIFLRPGCSRFSVSSVNYPPETTRYCICFEGVGNRTLRRICKELGLKLDS
jgi:hypothetical protein